MFGFGLHILEIHDAAVVGNKGDGQWQQRVAHPEAKNPGVVVDEQHALVDSHCLAVHQSHGLLLRTLSYFGLNHVHASRQFNRR